MSKFALGHVVATPGALDALARNTVTAHPYLQRHQSGDWGDLDAQDWGNNNAACLHEGDSERQSRIFSAYHLPDNTKIWIITEWDRSVTTVLLPEEY